MSSLGLSFSTTHPPTTKLDFITEFFSTDIGDIILLNFLSTPITIDRILPTLFLPPHIYQMIVYLMCDYFHYTRGYRRYNNVNNNNTLTSPLWYIAYALTQCPCLKLKVETVITTYSQKIIKMMTPRKKYQHLLP